jgi:hypothetical protein
MPDLIQPAVSAGILFSIAKLYAVSQGLPVPTSVQLTTSAALGASAYIAQYTEQDNAAVKALTTGSLFAGVMYFGFGSSDVVTYGVLGTAASYLADIVTEPIAYRK